MIADGNGGKPCEADAWGEAPRPSSAAGVTAAAMRN
jgi:hypothetical protein